MEAKREFPEGTLVYHHKAGHYPLYVVMSEDDGKFTLALPWQPEEAAVKEVRDVELEEVFEMI